MEACSTNLILPCYYENIAHAQIRKNLSFSFLRQSSNQKGVKHGYKRSRLALHSKNFFFQDFQAFVEPLRLLPVTEAMIFSEASLLELTDSSDAENSCLYALKLLTSNMYGSELRDVHAAILICLTDATRTSVLQRIPTVFTDEPEYMKAGDSNRIHFQSGSDEIILFSGPKLGKIEAMWVGLENGSWRLSGVVLMVLSINKSAGANEEPGNNFYSGSQYDFHVDDLLIGEGGDTSIAELRPKAVIDIPLLRLQNIVDTISSPIAPISNKAPNEEGMKQYSDLKLSLLIYDVILVSSGTVILDVSASEKTAYAFLFGGLSGLVYLLLLQKSVDALSASALPSVNTTGNFSGIFNAFKGPLSKAVFLLATIAAIAKYGLGISPIELTPQELLVGFVGFLTYKIAVLVSAFMPMGSSWREH